MVKAQDIIETMADMADEEQRKILCRFFKTGKGEYGEGDCFLGLKVPQTRRVVKEARLKVEFDEIEKLLYSEWHEVRLCGFLLLIEEMKKAGNPAERDRIAKFYLSHARQANNWDLVDLSAPGIAGVWFLDKTDRSILDRLAASDSLWEQRIAIVSTFTLIKAGQFDDTMRIAETLIPHPHDLIHKACGWMLRETGKRGGIETLRHYLDSHVESLPRTTLRYAIEKMDPDERLYWMKR